MIYTINGKHSDCYGHFTITADLLGLAPLEHQHSMEDIHGLAYAVLGGKSAVDHTHVALPALKVDDGEVTGPLSVAGGGSMTAAASGQSITLSSNPAPAGVAGAVINRNPVTIYSTLRFFCGSGARAAFGDGNDTTEFLTFKG